ncbi:MAG: DUF4838 domain-containing protein [Planctomycetes bacterium]|nr:DUF4838 domain-containing protein [Planctomycetota bacterium]
MPHHLYRVSPVALIALAVAFLTHCVAAVAGVVVIDQGQPRAILLIADQPASTAHEAATELQTYLYRISGATVPILKESDPAAGRHRGPRILVGRSKALAALGIEAPAGQDRDGTKEAFLLRTKGQDVAVIGNEDGPYRGTYYAACDLLERMGVRWYFPGDFGLVIPSARTVEIPDLNVEQRPSFRIRNIWLSGWADRTEGFEPWLRRNKGTDRGVYAFPGDGTIFRLAPPDKYFAQFPEIYAQGPDGKHYPRGFKNEGTHMTMLALSNPKTLEIAAKEVCDYFRANPGEMSFAFSAPDADVMSHDPATRAADHAFRLDSGLRDSISDSYFNFVNNLCHEVKKEFPDRQIVVLAYANRVSPPEGLERPWNRNVVINLAQLRVCSIHPLDSGICLFAGRQRRTIEAWERLGSPLLIYDYDPHADLIRMPFWNVHSIRVNLPYYKKHGVAGFTTEGHNAFLRTGLNYYLRCKLMWDADADVEALLADFYTRFFGPAAGAMKRFIEGIEAMPAVSHAHMTWTGQLGDWMPIFPSEPTRGLAKHLDAAERAAGDQEPFRTRIRAYRAVHQYMFLWQELVAAERAGEYRGALALLDRLNEPIKVVQAIQPGLFPPDPQWVVNEKRGTGFVRAQLQAMIDRDGGEKGRRLAIAPEKAQFKIDRRNQGLYAQWQRDEVARGVAWDVIPIGVDISDAGYREPDGYPYDGFAWYRFTVKPEAPEPLKADDNMFLYVPAVLADQLWVWCNGQLVHSPTDNPKTSDLDVDVTRWIKPGQENSFTFRMIGSPDRIHRRGLLGRPILWTPKH